MLVKRKNISCGLLLPQLLYLSFHGIVHNIIYYKRQYIQRFPQRNSTIMRYSTPQPRSVLLPIEGIERSEGRAYPRKLPTLVPETPGRKNVNPNQLNRGGRRSAPKVRSLPRRAYSGWPTRAMFGRGRQTYRGQRLPAPTAASPLHHDHSGRATGAVFGHHCQATGANVIPLQK